MEYRIAQRIWMAAAIVLLIALIGYIIWFPPTRHAAAGEAVAKVNDVTITKDQLYNSLVKSGGKQTLQNMIDQEIIRQEAQKAGVTVTDQDVNDELASVKKSFPSDEAFQQALAQYGMSLDTLKDNLKTQVYMRKLLSPQVKVTDADIESFYKDNLDSLKTPEQVRASHIVVAKKEDADAILADLKGGADFAAKAKAKSTDTTTKDKGGDLGFFAKGDEDPALEDAAFGLKVGETSGVVKTGDGYEIVRVTDRKEAVTPTLAEKKDEIRKQLIDQQVSQLSGNWLQQKESAAKIENYLQQSGNA